MKQQTLTGFQKYGMTARHAQFLADMDKIITWPELATAVKTVYPKVSENGGQPPVPLEGMLRIYFLQLWFSLFDPAVEEAPYDSVAMRAFVGIDQYFRASLMPRNALKSLTSSSTFGQSAIMATTVLHFGAASKKKNVKSRKISASAPTLRSRIGFH
jgi:hypothetical protein